MNALAPNASPNAPANDAGIVAQWLRLSVCEQPCAVPIERVREILQVGRLTAMPRTPAVVKGVMNLRGAVVPVIDLGERLFGTPVPVGRRSCIVIVDCGQNADPPGSPMGLLADAVFEVSDVDPASVSAVPPLGTPVQPQFLRGIQQSGAIQVQLLELDAVLAPAELAELIADRGAAPTLATTTVRTEPARALAAEAGA